jgi:hypothetical protein
MMEVFHPDGSMEWVEVPIDSTNSLSFPQSSPQSTPDDFEIVSLLNNGPNSGKIVITIMGDGFTATEQDAFIAAATKVKDSIVSTYPFSFFSDRFNIYAIKVISNESGAASHPSNLIDNYFGSTFNYDGVNHHLLALSNEHLVSGLLLQVALGLNFPVVLVNHNDFGGSGRRDFWGNPMPAVSSLNSSMSAIITHELGHSFGLADEYFGAVKFEAPNVTDRGLPLINKWRHWIDLENPPDYIGIEGIGIYPFADDPSWFHPHRMCKMSSIHQPFCRVCSSHLTERMAQITHEEFYGRSGVFDITIDSDATRILNYAFYGCQWLASITISSSVTSIGEYAFLGCNSLNRIINWAKTPQHIDAGIVFAGVNRTNIDLYVPKGSVSAYIAAGWTGFRNVFEVEITVSLGGLTWDGYFDHISLSGSNYFTGNVFVRISVRESADSSYVDRTQFNVRIIDGSASFGRFGVTDAGNSVRICIYENNPIWNSNLIVQYFVHPVLFNFNDP